MENTQSQGSRHARSEFSRPARSPKGGRFSHGSRTGGSAGNTFRTGNTHRGGYRGGQGGQFSGRRHAGGHNRGGRGNRFAGSLSEHDINRFINKAVITEETEHFKPEHSFSDFNVHQDLKQNISKKGYIEPTPIQDRAITHILQGVDVVGIANTGTGKTAAFLIPTINKLMMKKGERALIVAPTRELAIQIDDELRGFSQNLRIYSVCAVGGAPIGRQIAGLRSNPQFVIGTPGRIKDLIERRVLDLSHFHTAILDEADRMLDMGFINDMKFMMAKMPKERQTLFFSATLSPDIEGLIKDFLKEPVRISVKTGDTAKNVEQDVVRYNGTGKLNTLHDILKAQDLKKVLIFGRTKHGVEKLGQMLRERGFQAESIHGNKSHGQRQRALGKFKNNEVTILVATDVAARGLDISGISHVINYDIPATHDDYVHRIGRTGRGVHKGKAITFIEQK
jgi:ATP-dependent RNA helicase RhlE